MADFGGEMRMLVSGKPFIFRAKFSLDPVNAAVTAIPNQDGSLSRSFKPDGYSAEITFEDTPGTDWNSLMRAAPGPVSIIEDLTGTTHNFYNGFFEGSPMIDRETGEVTGLKVRASGYRRVVG
jgi:hypothetical protein